MSLLPLHCQKSCGDSKASSANNQLKSAIRKQHLCTGSPSAFEEIRTATHSFSLVYSFSSTTHKLLLHISLVSGPSSYSPPHILIDVIPSPPPADFTGYIPSLAQLLTPSVFSTAFSCVALSHRFIVAAPPRLPTTVLEVSLPYIFPLNKNRSQYIAKSIPTPDQHGLNLIFHRRSLGHQAWNSIRAVSFTFHWGASTASSALPKSLWLLKVFFIARRARVRICYFFQKNSRHRQH